MYQNDIDRFNEATYPLPPSCLISVHGSPGAVPTLHYSIPLEGVADPVTLFIHRKLQLESNAVKIIIIIISIVYVEEVLKLIASHEDTFKKGAKHINYCTFKII